MKKMLINASEQEEYRIAIVEEGQLLEYYTDSSMKKLTRGNIYKGVITNLESSLQAAFVEFGSERNGFLQINEIHPEYYQEEWLERGWPDIRKVLKKGQELLIQVTKEASGNKGAAVTTFISLAGRYIVLSPGRDNIGVSRSIVDEEERQRLKTVMNDLTSDPGFGYIVRTAAEGRTKSEIKRDLNHLRRLWEEMRKKVPDMPAPSLVHQEEDLTMRTIRDHFSSEIKEILIDDPEIYKKAREYMKVISPRYQKVVKQYKEDRPILSKHQIEDQLQNIFSERVKLKSGGSLVINQTEALVAVDVNSGRATKESRLENTAFKTNMEAAEEVARQLRLRDLGGLIVIDFIDMRENAHNRQLEKAFKAEIKKDKAKIELGRISKFGLMEMSRQRLRPPIEFGTFQTCDACGGRGVVRTPEVTALAVLRSITQRASKGQVTEVTGSLNPAVTSYLLNQKRAELLDLEKRFNIHISLEGDAAAGVGHSELEFIKRDSGSETSDADN